MLVQRRGGSLRLITQHEHALLAGRLAAAWGHPPEGAAGLPLPVVLATALHDAGWRDLDGVPSVDRESGTPLSFDRYPREEKFVAVGAWLDELETLDPYAAVLVSRHYATFGSGEEGPFHRREEARRRLLRGAASERFPAAEVEERHLGILRLLDHVSLLLCLAPPGAERDALPGWLDEDRLRLPDGAPLRMGWPDEERVRMESFPFRGDGLEVRVPYRELPSETPAEAWIDAWDRAPRSSVRIVIEAG